MVSNDKKPFATIESSLEFVELLQAAVTETSSNMNKDICGAQSHERRAEALLLVGYKLQQLSFHVAESERLLKDLRRLRNLILHRRPDEADMTEKTVAVAV